MSTEHDKMIKDAVDWAKSLGYCVVERHLGTESGADAIFENEHKEKVILEIVTGASFKRLFKKPRINKIFKTYGRYWIPPQTLGLIVVGDRIVNVKRHGVEAGLPATLFEPPWQRIFPVLTKDFEKVIPVLLVSLLGSRASLYERYSGQS